MSSSICLFSKQSTTKYSLSNSKLKEQKQLLISFFCFRCKRIHLVSIWSSVLIPFECIKLSISTSALTGILLEFMSQNRWICSKFNDVTCWYNCFHQSSKNEWWYFQQLEMMRWNFIIDGMQMYAHKLTLTFILIIYSFEMCAFCKSLVTI